MSNVVFLDKEREILFTMGGIELLAKKYGSLGEALKGFQGFSKGSGIMGLTPEILETIISLAHVGLMPGDLEITRETVANIVTIENLDKVIYAIAKGLGFSLPEPIGENENPPKA